MKRDERIAALARVPLFADVNRKTLRSIDKKLSERTFPAGTTVATQGKLAIGFFIIAEGEAEVTVDGKPVRHLRAGDYFGEIALLGQGPRSATVTATTDMRCLEIDAWHFRPIVKSNPDLSWALLETLAKRVVDEPGTAG